MSQERDNYLVAKALFIAANILNKAKRHSDAADMMRLLQSPRYMPPVHMVVDSAGPSPLPRPN
jgi:hypothetical protein